MKYTGVAGTDTESRHGRGWRGHVRRGRPTDAKHDARLVRPQAWHEAKVVGSCNVRPLAQVV